MASSPEEDVPARGGPGDGDTTAAEARPPAASVTGVDIEVPAAPLEPIEEEDEHTVRQDLDPEIAKLVRNAPRPGQALPPLAVTLKGAPPSVAPSTRAPTPRPAAGMPPPSASPPTKPLPAAGRPAVPPSSEPLTQPGDKTHPTPTEDDDEELEDSITATAPRVAAKIALSLPGSVEIRTVEPEEPEVETMAGPLEPAVARVVAEHAPHTEPAPTASIPSTEPEERDAHDDGPTAQALAPSVGQPMPITERTTEQVALSALPSTKPETQSPADSEPITTTGVTTGVTQPREAVTQPGHGAVTSPDSEDAYDAEESITSRGLSLAATERAAELASAKVGSTEEDDESITQQGPLIGKPRPAAGAPPPASDLDGETTQSAAREIVAAAVSSLPADDELDSVTTQAPGNLTNMLRVIASGSRPDVKAPLEDDDEDALPENKTAVMIGAPVKLDPLQKHGTLQGFPPAPLPVGADPRSSARVQAASSARAVAAPQLDRESDSGLRVARPQHGSASGERASVGVLGAADAADPSPLHPNIPNDGSVGRIALAETEYAPPIAPSRTPSLSTKRPRYGLLVAVVATISIAVPVSLFFFLRSGGDAAAVVEPAGENSDLVKRGDPQLSKWKRGMPLPPAPSASSSAAPTPSASASSKPVPWWQRH